MFRNFIYNHAACFLSACIAQQKYIVITNSSPFVAVHLEYSIGIVDLLSNELPADIN